MSLIINQVGYKVESFEVELFYGTENHYLANKRSIGKFLEKINNSVVGKDNIHFQEYSFAH